jgi:hypothetical protein
MRGFLGRNKVPNLICIACAVAFIAINLHVLAIGLLPTDDHEIVMASSDPLGSWLNSEALRPWSRWRPSYYTIRYLEALLWQNNAFAWHAARLIAIGAGICLLSLSSIKIIGKATAILLGITLVFSPVLNDLVQILGPAETYCFLGLSLWAYGCTGLLESIGLLSNECDASPEGSISKARSSWLYSLFVLMGSLIAAGSKENLVILIFPNLWLLYQSMFLAKPMILQRGTKITLAIASLCMLPMIAFLGILYSSSGQDIYSKSLKPSSIELLKYTAKSFHIGGLAVAGVSLLTLLRSAVKRKFATREYILAFLLFMSVWSIYFNRDVTPFYSGSRYALLHQLGILGMFFMIISYWFADLSKWGDTFKKLSFSAICLTIIIPGSILALRNNAASSTRAAQSARWRGFTLSVADLHKKTNLPIFIVSSHWINSYESSYSAARFLRFMHGVNPKNIYLSYAPDYETKSREKDDFQVALESSIQNPKGLDNHLRSPSGGVVTLQKPLISRGATQNNNSERICADPIGSTDKDVQLLLQNNCKRTVSF